MSVCDFVFLLMGCCVVLFAVLIVFLYMGCFSLFLLAATYTILTNHQVQRNAGQSLTHMHDSMMRSSGTTQTQSHFLTKKGSGGFKRT